MCATRESSRLRYQLARRGDMKKSPSSLLGRALVVSVVLNLTLLTLPSLFDPGKFTTSRLGKIVDALGAPGGMVVERFLPGHDLTQVLVMLLSSLAFYTIIVWAVLTAWVAVRPGKV